MFGGKESSLDESRRIIDSEEDFDIKDKRRLGEENNECQKNRVNA